MAWARFDDNYDANPKIRAAGLYGKSLHESSIRYCCRVNSGGKILKAAFELVAVLAQLTGSKPAQRKVADTLVSLNLWEDKGDHWMIHDFDDYAAPLRYLRPEDRPKPLTKNHAGREENDEALTKNHAARDPVPVPVLVSFNKETLSLCELMLTLLRENGCKAPAEAPQAWLVEADRLLRLDSREYQEACDLLRWAAQDAFWKTNILSIPKFREQYDKLRLKKNQAAPEKEPTLAERIARRSAG